MTELICIVCPKGCRLTVDDALRVTGHSCPRGEAYGKEEARHPVRVVTSTVRIEGGGHRRCPVKTNGKIPKGLIFEAMKTLDAVCLKAPVEIGQVAVNNVCGTGVDFITTNEISGTQEFFVPC
ncbi:MAG: DUF1667 domain-containing protein [Clostridiales bacterium]|nr:DUF1667 domain-containing protein [Clostridiales bacterium]